MSGRFEHTVGTIAVKMLAITGLITIWVESGPSNS